MGEVLKNAQMINFYIIASHSPFSPGGVWGERTEHEDVKKFARLLEYELKKHEDVNVFVYGGRVRPAEHENSVMIILHRGTNSRNSRKYGAEILVRENSDCDVQMKAYRLLRCVCLDGGFRYRGVHVFSEKCPHKSIEKSGTPDTFLLTMGYIEEKKDNDIFDKRLPLIAADMACELINIYVKESQYEDFY